MKRTSAETEPPERNKALKPEKKTVGMIDKKRKRRKKNPKHSPSICQSPKQNAHASPRVKQHGKEKKKEKNSKMSRTQADTIRWVMQRKEKEQVNTRHASVYRICICICICVSVVILTRSRPSPLKHEN
jgi:hypothetical protein